MATVDVRPARQQDLPAISRIYDHYVLETAVTFDVAPRGTEAARAWFGGFSLPGRHRLVVAAEGEDVLGWAASHAFRVKAAYDTSVETSIYLRQDRVGAGLGSRLYASLFEALEGEDVHRAYAGITLPNPASLALHRRFGFESVGVFREVGRKLGRWWDVEWFEKALG